MNHVSQLDINGYLWNEAAFQPMEEARDEVIKCFLSQNRNFNQLTQVIHAVEY